MHTVSQEPRTLISSWISVSSSSTTWQTLVSLPVFDSQSDDRNVAATFFCSARGTSFENAATSIAANQAAKLQYPTRHKNNIQSPVSNTWYQIAFNLVQSMWCLRLLNDVKTTANVCFSVRYYQWCARDLSGRDRDETRDTEVRDRDVGHFGRDETRDAEVRDRDETFWSRDETETEMLQLLRPWPRRVVYKNHSAQ